MDNITEYDKLVRDNIPDIIRSNGDEPIYRILEDNEYLEYLYKKDIEELEEVKLSNTKEEVKKELADKLEIIKAIASYYNYSLDDIIKEADRKTKKNGAFRKKILLIRTINNKGSDK